MNFDKFKRELTELINKHSAENGSNTPDFILAEYLIGCLVAFNLATKERDHWYSVELRPGGSKFKQLVREMGKEILSETSAELPDPQEEGDR